MNQEVLLHYPHPELCAMAAEIEPVRCNVYSAGFPKITSFCDLNAEVTGP